MKKVVIFIALLMVLSGCMAPQMPKGTAGMFDIVLDRHDEYVSKDPEIDEADKVDMLASTEILRKYLKEVRAK